MELILPLFGLNITFSMSINVQTPYTKMITELNNTFFRLDNASAMMLAGYEHIAVHHPESEEVMNKLFAGIVDLMGRNRQTIRPLRELVLPLSAAKQKGFDIPAFKVPAMTGLTTEKLVSTIRASCNSLERQWEEAMEGILKIPRDSGPEITEDFKYLVDKINATLQSAVRPLKKKLSKVPEPEESETIMKELEQLQSEYTENEQIILGSLSNLGVGKGQLEYIAEMLKDYKKQVKKELLHADGVEVDKLTAEMKDHVSALKLLPVPSTGLRGQKWFKLKEKLFEHYEDAVTTELDAITLQYLHLGVQRIQDCVEAQQEVISAIEQQQPGYEEIAQMVIKMILEIKSAHQRFLAANVKLRDAAPDHKAHKTQIAIKAAEATSAAIIRDTLAKALTTKNISGIIPLYQEISVQLEWLDGYAEQMVQVLIKYKEKTCTHFLKDWRQQIQAANDVVKVASALHNATGKLQATLQGYPGQLNLVNGVIKGALQKLLVTVLGTITEVWQKETVGGEIYTKLYEKVKTILDARVIESLQHTFHTNNKLPEELVIEIRAVLDELTDGLHSPSKLEIFKEDL